MPHAMRLRALVHRHATVSLKQQGAELKYRSGYTTKPQKPREHVEDPVEYYSDSDSEELPPTVARLAGLEGELSDVSEPSDDGECGAFGSAAL